MDTSFKRKATVRYRLLSGETQARPRVPRPLLWERATTARRSTVGLREISSFALG